ncbi:MAG TPA: response regulator transcription factor [Ktedonobacteraceae bacterium]|nr:response regulator transcription factor [Ktedonobacteraceae bacterium]
MQKLNIERNISLNVPIVVIERHTLVRKGICNIISKLDYIDHLQEADTVSKIEFDKTGYTTIFLLGTSTSLTEYLYLMEIIKNKTVSFSVLALIQLHGTGMLKFLADSGVHGILDQDATEQDLDIAIKTCLMGNIFRSRRVEEAMKLCSNDKTNMLTFRELHVLTLIGQGEDNVSIAKKLFITNKTVEAHITRIFGKLGVRSRVQAVLRAQDLNLIVKN